MQAQIISIKTFDANKGTTISFDWAGSAISKIRCIIKTNDSSEEVYNEIYESSSVIFAPYTYKIPSSSGLENGKNYNAFIQVYIDKTKEWSDIQSLGTAFKCIATPSFEFSDISSIITNSNQTFYLNYNSNKSTGEQLRSYVINIYDASNKIIDTSGTRYYTPPVEEEEEEEEEVTPTEPTEPTDPEEGGDDSGGEGGDEGGGDTPTPDPEPTPVTPTPINVELVYQASGFTSGVTYHIQAFAETVSGMSLSTSVHQFTLETPKGDEFYILDATNIACQGGIQLETYIAIVDAFFEKHDGRYIVDNDGNAIMMSTRNNTLSYREGFKLSGDFTISMIAADIDQNENILTLSDKQFDRDDDTFTDPKLIVKLFYICGKIGTPEPVGVFELQVIEDGVKTVYFSNQIPAAIPEDLIRVNIVRSHYKDDGALWNLAAHVITSDDRIYARHHELNVLTHNALGKYTHREIQLGYPLDYEEYDRG